MKSKNLLFDLDGTLWDARIPVAESWTLTGRRFFGPQYQVKPEEVEKLMGLTMKEIGERLVGIFGEGVDAASFTKASFEEEVHYLYDHPGSLFEKEEETLSSLKESGHSLYIVSNCQKGYIEAFLHALKHPEVFSGRLCFGDTKQSKDKTIRRLMGIHGLKDALYIGDTGKDEEAANKAGIGFIFASYGFGSASSPLADLPAFSLLPSLLKKLGE